MPGIRLPIDTSGALIPTPLQLMDRPNTDERLKVSPLPSSLVYSLISLGNFPATKLGFFKSGAGVYFPITETLEILRFAKVLEGDIELTPAGLAFAQGDIQAQKTLFATHLMRYVPLARHIRRVLDERSDHMVKEERFLRELEDYLSEQVAEEVLATVIDWARYAEIFAFDYNAGLLSLENPD